MANILLTSETFVKSTTGLRNNMAGAYMLPAMREAQENGLRTILGDVLTDKLCSLVADGTISDEGNAQYKALLDKCQYYLAYMAAVEVTMRVSLKIGNLGVSKASDENVTPVDNADVARMQEWWQDKADAACLQLQRWTLENKASFPELTEADCYRLRANLYSAASCGIWLGGPRGKGGRP